ncbi:MAG: hypothetical protein M3R02_26615 [Chloroflexota bacterium]|nr:hypothetical protein [Chloroflexota bacterium]
MSFAQFARRYLLEQAAQQAPPQAPLRSSTPMPPSAAELALAARLTSVYGHPGNLESSTPMPPSAAEVALAVW